MRLAQLMNNLTALSSSIARLLEQSQRIAIVSHLNPDGDALGSILALHRSLSKHYPNKTFYAACNSPIAEQYHFLPDYQVISRELAPRILRVTVDTKVLPIANIRAKQDDGQLNLYLTPQQGSDLNPLAVAHLFSPVELDLIVVLDCGDLFRVGSFYDDHREVFSRTPIVNIDHHHDNTHFGTINFVDEQAASTTQLIYQLMLALNLPLDEAVATDLLTGIITDTGNFQYTSTSPETLFVASKLIAAGAAHQTIIEHLYRMKKHTTLRLWGTILAKVSHTASEKIIWSTVEQRDLDEAGAIAEEADGVIDELLMTTPRAEVIMLFYEQHDMVRVSIRTVEEINAITLAEAFGGGGHPRAAGFRLRDISLSEAVRKVTAEVQAMYESGKAHENIQGTSTRVTDKQQYTPEGIIQKLGEITKSQ